MTRCMASSSRRHCSATTTSNGRLGQSKSDTSPSTSHPASPMWTQPIRQSLWTTVLQRAEQTLATRQFDQLQQEKEPPMDEHFEKEDPTKNDTINCQHQDTPSSTTRPTPPSTSSRATMDLISQVLERAESTMSMPSECPSTTTSDERVPPSAPTSHETSVMEGRDTTTPHERTTRPQDNSATGSTSPSPKRDDNDVVALRYGQNPTITSTALAHMLWSTVLRPGIDSAIDATAGNGSDSLVLARLLFSSADRDSTTTTPNNNNNSKNTNRSQLLAVDVQDTACQKTRHRLNQFLTSLSDRHEDRVQVVCTSHAPLPLPVDTSNIALVVYNLGYLPNHKNDHETSSSTSNPTTRVKTQTETTLASLADAALALRVGGMLSVLTYPRSNATEDAVVRAFLEGLALFSSQTRSYTDYVQTLESCCVNESLRERLRVTLQHVREEGGRQQTWRVHEHKKLGWVDAPILLTATRIK